ncbi:hypothetical protein IWZ00DRAFT_544014 [Phyllosticta capitalensis]|uniref:Uncharacterized protein n=1 Tax=Phyllosticta capitalensis TaxID=121624 RepID=A0ABR1YVC1_9PEZI
MALPQIILTIVFLLGYVGAVPMPRPQGCGSSSMACCLRRGATNLRCEGQSAADYDSHSGNFDPYDVFNGATIQNIDFPVAINAGEESISLGRIRFTLYPDTNQFRTTTDPDIRGPMVAVQQLHARDSRIAGILIRWGVFRAQAGVDENNPRNWFIVSPVRRGTLTQTEQGFGEAQLYGHVTHTNNPNLFYNSADMPRRNIHYRIFFSALATDIDGNIVTDEP